MSFRYLDPQGQPQEFTGHPAQVLAPGRARLGETNLRCAVWSHEEAVDVWYQGRLYRIPRLLGPRRSGSRHLGAAESELKAKMPGTVLQLKVAVGDQVRAGDPVLVMESMKMELTVEAPGDGVIAEICCEPGQLVDLGAVLLRLEPEE